MIWAPLRMDIFQLRRFGSLSLLLVGIGRALFGWQPRHHRAQLLTNLFHWMPPRRFAQLGKGLAAFFVLLDPLFRECSILDSPEHFFHRLARRVSNHHFTTGQVA